MYKISILITALVWEKLWNTKTYGQIRSLLGLNYANENKHDATIVFLDPANVETDILNECLWVLSTMIWQRSLISVLATVITPKKGQLCIGIKCHQQVPRPWKYTCRHFKWISIITTCKDMAVMATLVGPYIDEKWYVHMAFTLNLIGYTSNLSWMPPSNIVICGFPPYDVDNNNIPVSACGSYMMFVVDTWYTVQIAGHNLEWLPIGRCRTIYLQPT